MLRKISRFARNDRSESTGGDKSFCTPEPAVNAYIMPPVNSR